MAARAAAGARGPPATAAGRIAAETVERRVAATIDRQRRDVLLARVKVEIGQVLEAGPSLPGRRRLELCGRLLDDIGSEPDAPGERFELTMPTRELDELFGGMLARIDRELEDAAAEGPDEAGQAARALRIDERLDARAVCTAVLEALR